MMTTSKTQAYQRLVQSGRLSQEQLKQAQTAAGARQRDLETILMEDFSLSRRELLGVPKV